MGANLLVNPKLVAAAADKPHLVRCYTPDNAQGQVYYDTEGYGNLTRPEGWSLWCIHSREERHPWDPDNTEGWVVPEVKLTELKPDASPQYPDRWHGDARSLVFFNRDRTSIGGIGQRVAAVAGHTYSFGGWAEGWNAGDEFGGDPHCSWGAGCAAFAMAWDEIRTRYSGQMADALEALRFRVGIDPTGGTNPLAETVVWGQAVAIYNAWAEMPAVSAKAQGDVVTVFVWAENRWRSHMNDRYVTDFWLMDNDGEDPGPQEPPEPGGEYDYPVVARGSKLTAHAIGEGGTYDLVRYLAERGAALPALKVVAAQAPKDLAAIRTLQALSPETRIIARVILADGGFNPQGWHAGLDAEAYMSRFTAWAKAYPEVAWWELWNEQDPPGTAGHVAMARFAVECMQIAEREGYRLALMSYSSGVPENEEWRAIWEETTFFQQARAGGHILALHAYCRTGDAAQTAAHLLRPRWLYENILIPNDCVVPFVFTEYSIDETRPGVGISDWSAADLMAEYDRVSLILGQMWYCLGAAVYTFGALAHYNHDRLWREFGDLILAHREQQNALPPAAPGDPDEGYDSTVLVVDYERIADPEMRRTLYLEGWARGIYVGPSHDEARAWPERARSRTVELPGFSEADVAHVAFYRAGNPKTQLVFRAVPGQEPPEEPAEPPAAGYPWDRDLVLALPHRTDYQNLTHPSLKGVGWWQRRPDQITHVTVHHTGGWSTWAAYAADHIQRDGGTPSIHYTIGIDRDGTINLMTEFDLDAPTHPSPWHDQTGYQNRHLAVCLAGALHTTPPTDAQLASLVKVCAWAIREPRLPGVTRQTITGHMDWYVTACPGWASAASGNWQERFHALLDAELGDAPLPDPQPAPARVLVGFNDPNNAGAGKWMADEGVKGLLVVPVFLGGSAARLDLSAYEAAGIRVIVNLRYSWSTDCGGAGTLPRTDSAGWRPFVDAAIETIKQSQGVWGWEIGNEANNPREFPREGVLTADQVAQTYNAIWRETVNAGTRLAPGALDPFNAQAGDPRTWLARIFALIDGAGFVAAHGYVRGPDAAQVGSTASFGDDPLRWQALNYPLCVTRLLEALPAWAHGLEVYVTEFNHLWRTTEGDWGWVDDLRAGEVVQAAYTAAQAAGFAGVALYRWDGDAWTVARNGAVLGAVRQLSVTS